MNNDEEIHYLDTNLYLAYFFGEKNNLQHIDQQKIDNELKQFRLSESFFDSNKNIFFPNILGTEIYSSIRSTLSKNPLYQNENKLNEESTKLFQVIISDIIHQKNFKFEQSFEKNEANLNQIMKDSAKIIMSIKGVFKPLNHCNICGSYGKQNVYKILNIVDIMHILFAREFRCKKFITFDQYFREIEQYADIKPVEIQIMH